MAGSGYEFGGFGGGDELQEVGVGEGVGGRHWGQVVEVQEAEEGLGSDAPAGLFQQLAGKRLFEGLARFPPAAGEEVEALRVADDQDRPALEDEAADGGDVCER